MIANQIKLKTPDVFVALASHSYHPTLIQIIAWILSRWGGVITEAYRPARHAGDVHSTDPVRAIDLRSWHYTSDQLTDLLTHVNSRWIYDPARPSMRVALHHKVAGGAYHLHIQVHPNTVEVS